MVKQRWFCIYWIVGLSYLFLHCQQSLCTEVIPSVSKKVKTMTIEDKIGQLIMTCFVGDELNQAGKALIQDLRVGNIIYFKHTNSLKNPQAIASLSKQIHNFTLQHLDIVPIIAMDQEGGKVARMRSECTEFPGNMALAATNDLTLAEEASSILGFEAKGAGVNCVLAPVVDVNSNLYNPVIGVRSFSSCPELVVQFAKKTIEGLKKSNILTTLKHFPGHGDTVTDSHVDVPCIVKNRQELEKCEFIPFYALKDCVDSIMIGHLYMPELDKEEIATFSKKIVTDLLRESWNFSKVIFSDSLVMQGAVGTYETFEEAKEKVAEAAIKAFQAGCDCLLIGRLEGKITVNELQQHQLIQHVVYSLKNAILKNEALQKRLDESVTRILMLKYCNNESWTQDETRFTYSTRPCQVRYDFMKNIFSKSLTLLSPRCLFQQMDMSITGKKICIVTPEVIQNHVQEALSKYKVQEQFFMTYSSSIEKEKYASITDAIAKVLSDIDLVIFIDDSKAATQQNLLHSLYKYIPAKKLLIIGTANPQYVFDSEKNAQYLTFVTYNSSKYAFEAVFDHLNNKKIPTGILPLYISK